MKRFFLEVLNGPAGGEKVEVSSSITLGRGHGNDLAFTGEDAGIVSARHALVALKSRTLWLRDLDSTNGTFVGKVRVTERELLGGEIIMLGPDGPAMRVEVAEVEDAAAVPAHLRDKGRETTTMAVPDLGLLGKKGGTGNMSLILEMARRLRGSGNPQEVMQGLMQDPERLSRLLKGGVMPERVADWLGSIGSRLTRSRKRLLWIGGVGGAAAFIALAALGWQNFSYRAKLKKQGNLLGQIHALEQDLDGLSAAGDGKAGDRTRLVHELLSAEKQLFQIREKIKLTDRASTYRTPLGGEVHQVLEELGKKGFIVPESFIKSVEEEIDGFTKPGSRATLQRCFARKPRFERLIRRELARSKLPSDFLYIAMQESLFDSAAQSGNDARGLWQMVPETAREFDLAVPEDWKTQPPHLDERTRPLPATRAAAAYLHMLYSEFGDAALAMAAYNAGAGKMRKTLRRIEDPVNDRDFWYIYRMGMMSPETREYVPKIIAMILIDRNRERYGFKG